MNEQPLALTDQIVRQQEEIEVLTKERDELKHDIEAYRGALGYSVSGNHDGKLADGTTPQCGLCNSEWRKGLESRAETAEAKCSEMRDAIEANDHHHALVDDRGDYLGSKLYCINDHALSTDCGQPILERVKRLERFQKRLEWLHDCSHGTKDGEGYEWGVARVKWDSNGKPLSVLWTNSDHSDLDAEMQKEQI